MGKYTANDLDPGAYKPGSLREPTHPMSNPVSVGDDLVAYLSNPPDGGNRHWGSDYSRAMAREAASQLAAVTAENARLRRSVADYAQGCRDIGATAKHNLERATTAEAQLKTTREALEDLKEGKVDSLGDFIALADAALNPKAPS